MRVSRQFICEYMSLPQHYDILPIACFCHIHSVQSFLQNRCQGNDCASPSPSAASTLTFALHCTAFLYNFAENIIEMRWHSIGLVSFTQTQCLHMCCTHLHAHALSLSLVLSCPNAKRQTARHGSVHFVALSFCIL